MQASLHAEVAAAAEKTGTWRAGEEMEGPSPSIAERKFYFVLIASNELCERESSVLQVVAFLLL